MIRRRRTVGAVDLVHIGETGQICNKEEIEEQLDVRGLFVVLKLGIGEESLVVSIDIRVVILSRMFFASAL